MKYVTFRWVIFVFASAAAGVASASNTDATPVRIDSISESGLYFSLTYRNGAVFDTGRDFLQDGAKPKLGEHTVGASIGGQVMGGDWGSLSLGGGFDYHPESDECQTISPMAPAAMVYRIDEVCVSTAAYNLWVGPKLNIPVSDALRIGVGAGLGYHLVDIAIDFGVPIFNGENAVDGQYGGLSYKVSGEVSWAVDEVFSVGTEIQYIQYREVEPMVTLGVIGTFRF